jgi:hypothetical protein
MTLVPLMSSGKEDDSDENEEEEEEEEQTRIEDVVQQRQQQDEEANVYNESFISSGDPEIANQTAAESSSSTATATAASAAITADNTIDDTAAAAAATTTTTDTATAALLKLVPKPIFKYLVESGKSLQCDYPNCTALATTYCSFCPKIPRKIVFCVCHRNHETHKHYFPKDLIESLGNNKDIDATIQKDMHEGIAVAKDEEFATEFGGGARFVKYTVVSGVTRYFLKISGDHIILLYFFFD